VHCNKRLGLARDRLRHLRIDRRIHPGDSAPNSACILDANGAAIKSAKYDNVNACKRATQLQRCLGFSYPVSAGASAQESNCR
jgi:hypothetical protein